MSSLVEPSPINHDSISQATPSFNTNKSYLSTHQRYYSSQISQNSLPQSATSSKILLPSQLSSNAINKKQDFEPKFFQTPSTSQHVKSSSQQLDALLHDINIQNRAHIRTSRVYTMDDMKSLSVQTSAPYDNQKQKQIIPATSTPSPLLLQFENTDLRKRISLAPIKLDEMRVDKKTEFKLDSQISNFKFDNQFENNTNKYYSNTDMQSPIETKTSKYYFIDNDFVDENLGLNDQDETEEDLIEDFSYNNQIIEIKSSNNNQLKGILKKSSFKLASIDSNKLIEQSQPYLSSNNKNLDLSQNIYSHLRSTSYQVFPNYTPEKSSTKNQFLTHTNSLNIYNDSKIGNTTKSHLRRSQSLNGYSKKVSFMNSPVNQDLLLSDNGSLISSVDLYSSPQLSSKYSSSPIYIYDNSINMKKSNHFSKFYSEFKNNLNCSKAEILFSSQDNSTLNNSNSTNITVSTVHSQSSIQFSSLQTETAAVQISSSGCSTPVTSQQNTNSPKTNQQNFESQSKTSSKAILQSVFKDMKLTKNTKVYLDTTAMNKSPNFFNNNDTISSLNQNQISQSHSETLIGQKPQFNLKDLRRMPSIESFNFNS